MVTTRNDFDFKVTPSLSKDACTHTSPQLFVGKLFDCFFRAGLGPSPEGVNRPESLTAPTNLISSSSGVEYSSSSDQRAVTGPSATSSSVLFFPSGPAAYAMASSCVYCL